MAPMYINVFKKKGEIELFLILVNDQLDALFQCIYFNASTCFEQQVTHAHFYQALTDNSATIKCE